APLSPSPTAQYRARELRTHNSELPQTGVVLSRWETGILPRPTRDRHEDHTQLDPAAALFASAHRRDVRRGVGRNIRPGAVSGWPAQRGFGTDRPVRRHATYDTSHPTHIH